MENKELQQFIEEKVFPIYEKNDKGHGLKHIYQVIERSMELIEENNLDVNKDMAYVIAAYHDIGRYSEKDKGNHEKISAQMMKEDTHLKKFFTPEQLTIIEEAIVDHRASLEYEPRSIYGKLVSSADRAIDVDTMLERSFYYQKNKHPEANIEEVIEFSYQKLSKKYGINGYAKMYFKDEKYEKFIKQMQEILVNKEKFFEMEKKIYEQEK